MPTDDRPPQADPHAPPTPEAFGKAFTACTTEALTMFRNTAGQCVGLCAVISRRLTEGGIPNNVALGSLFCRGVLAVKYSGPFVTDGYGPVDWDGHAWIEFPGRIIGEPSLLRTAKAAPQHSNLRQSLERQGLIDKGAFIVPKRDALVAFGLKYKRMAYLAEAKFEPVINGLVAMNAPAP